jgi:phosphate-selective porin OprO/OprP
MGAWQVAARYSFVDLSDEDILGGRQSNGALALVWYFNPHSALLFNAIYGDIEDHSPVAGYTDGHYTAFGTRLRVDF